jgi:hypothetical protein
MGISLNGLPARTRRQGWTPSNWNKNCSSNKKRSQENATRDSAIEEVEWQWGRPPIPIPAGIFSFLNSFYSNKTNHFGRAKIRGTTNIHGGIKKVASDVVYCIAWCDYYSCLPVFRSSLQLANELLNLRNSRYMIYRVHMFYFNYLQSKPWCIKWENLISK